MLLFYPFGFSPLSLLSKCIFRFVIACIAFLLVLNNSFAAFLPTLESFNTWVKEPYRFHLIILASQLIDYLDVLMFSLLGSQLPFAFIHHTDPSPP